MSEGVFYRPPAAGVYDSSAGGLGTSPTWLSPMEGGKGEPPGVIHMYCGTTAPGGYLFCDGAQVDRKTYKRLYTLFGDSFGSGDGSTTFNLPDLRGRIPVGSAPGGRGECDVVGDNEGLPPESRSPKHNHPLPNHGHSVSDPGHQHGIPSSFDQQQPPNHNVWAATTAELDVTGTPTRVATTGISVGNPTSNPPVGPSGTSIDAPAYLVINYIIKT